MLGSKRVRLDLDQAETAHIAREQGALLDEARSKLLAEPCMPAATVPGRRQACRHGESPGRAPNTLNPLRSGATRSAARH